MTKLRKISAEDQNSYNAAKTDRNGRAFQLYEVTVDGVRIGRVYQVEERYTLTGRTRVAYGFSYDRRWVADTKANDAMHGGIYGAGSVNSKNRADAVARLIELAAR
jgi:hypothetical protein